MGKKKKKLDKQRYSVDLVIPVSHAAADDHFIKLLRYWDSILEPKEGAWEHADDVAPRIERQKAIRLLLEFMEG